MRRTPSSLVVGLAFAAACGPARAPAIPQVCPSDRVVVLAGQDDIAQFAGCKTAVGVTIRTGMALDFTPLRALETIAGDLVIGPSIGLEEVTFPELAHVNGTIKVVSNQTLRGLFLPRLEQAGRIVVDGNVSLSTLSLPRLQTVQGGVAITDGPNFELIEASSLVTVGKELAISRLPELVLLELGKLEHVESLRIEDCPKLPTEMVDKLRARAVR